MLVELVRRNLDDRAQIRKLRTGYQCACVRHNTTITEREILCERHSSVERLAVETLAFIDEFALFHEDFPDLWVKLGWAGGLNRSDIRLFT